jgi:glutathione-specific gamma-glutamylcyclotransferase
MSDFWVFGYGSLMWRPGFPFIEAIHARLHGEHRALCVLSYHHRGTREKPGLVLGLDMGGICRGVAFRVPISERDGVVAYLRERELVNGVYHEVERNIEIDGEGNRIVQALTYVADRSHEQYAGQLDPEVVLERVRDSIGVSGANRDYVIMTARYLEQMGIHDPLLGWLASKLDEAPGEPAE